MTTTINGHGLFSSTLNFLLLQPKKLSPFLLCHSSNLFRCHWIYNLHRRLSHHKLYDEADFKFLLQCHKKEGMSKGVKGVWRGVERKMKPDGDPKGKENSSDAEFHEERKKLRGIKGVYRGLSGRRRERIFELVENESCVCVDGGYEWDRYFVSAVSEVGRVSFLERIVEGEFLGSI
ncbi:hypothetical protein COLO4_37737 [Corchorus olitorius]|uniref:Uncharacterized protein n=1 Tax=Corchorus olitorius TaxID=93759 RepID=A0A1R3FZT5_9ROSI|nr:hypothetical protein COLO4_37737 [Corchorus olitorius]